MGPVPPPPPQLLLLLLLTPPPLAPPEPVDLPWSAPTSETRTGLSLIPPCLPSLADAWRIASRTAISADDCCLAAYKGLGFRIHDSRI